MDFAIESIDPVSLDPSGDFLQKMHFYLSNNHYESHSPKHLITALYQKVKDMKDHFQELTEDQSYQISVDEQDKLEDEIREACVMLLQFAHQYGLDPLEIMRKKTKNIKPL